MNKVIQLADYEHLKSRILLPALEHAKERAHVTPQEALILVAATQAGVIKSSGIASADVFAGFQSG